MCCLTAVINFNIQKEMKGLLYESYFSLKKEQTKKTRKDNNFALHKHKNRMDVK